MNEEQTELTENVLKKIEFGEDLIHSLKVFNKIEGIQKLHAKIKQELTFLKKVFFILSL